MERVARMNAARERRRFERVGGEPIRKEVRGTHCYTFTVHDHHRGVVRSIELFVSERRINSYRVTIDGVLWRDAISMSRLLSALRKKMPPMRQLT